MLPATITGHLVAVLPPKDYDMTAQGGPKGISRKALVSVDFTAAPITVKFQPERAGLHDDLTKLGFGVEVEIVGEATGRNELSAINVKALDAVL